MSRLTDETHLEDEHRLFRQQVRRFVSSELAPHVDAWEDAESFPREVFRKLGDAGFLGVSFPEEYGGGGGDLLYTMIIAEEFTRSGSPGLAASLGSLSIALPPIVNAGTEEQKHRWLPPVVRGEQIAALAVTEPGAGSDVASVTTRAVRDGDTWVVDGSKTFITSGTRADLYTVVARTGGPGAGGISLLIVEADRPGFERSSNLRKMGWHASDTAELFFDGVRVPAENLIGPESGGFGVLMQNFASERMMLAATAVEIAQLAWEAAAEHARSRQAFARPLIGFQVTRHKLADMRTRIEAARAFIYTVASAVLRGHPAIAEVAMAKNAATDVASSVVDDAVQIHGGMGFMHGTLVERLYRDARLYPIGGGTREIMNEIIARTLPS